MAPRKHVIITGTGRAGTTFLVQLMTHLGLDTGFRPDTLDSGMAKEGRAGLEHDVRRDGCPYVAKDPYFCGYAEEVLGRDDIVIEHVFVPMRDLEAAAESRRHVRNTGFSQLSLFRKLRYLIHPRRFKGGLWDTHSTRSGVQEEILLKQIYALLLAVSDGMMPMTFMRFPKIVKDGAYLYEKLKPVLGDRSYEAFTEAFKKTVRPDLIHRFTPKDS